MAGVERSEPPVAGMLGARGARPQPPVTESVEPGTTGTRESSDVQVSRLQLLTTPALLIYPYIRLPDFVPARVPDE